MTTMVGTLRKAIRAAARSIVSDRRGQSVIEFAVALPFLVLMSVGTFAVGMIIDRHLTLGQLVRSSGNMYARGIDFQVGSNNRQFLIDAASGMDLQLSGGKSALYMTLLTRVPAATTCSVGSPNAGLIVIAQRFSLGDTTSNSKMHSQLGMPANLQYDGNHADFICDADAVVSAPPAALSDATNGMQENEFVYVVEAIHRPQTIAFQGIFAPEYMYSRAFF